MTSKELTQMGIAASRAGRNQEARELLTRAVDLDPDNEGAWLWLSGAVGTDEERLTCLEQVVAINPRNAAAQRGMDLLRAKGVQPVAAPPQPLARPVLEPLAVKPLAPTQTPNLDQAKAAPTPMADPAAGTAKHRDDVPPTVFWLALAALGAAIVCALAMLVYQLLGPGIQLPGARPTESPSAVTDVLYEQLTAYNAEDIERYLATMHSETKGLAQIRSTLTDLLAKYDLQARLYDVEVVEVTSREARVSFTLETRKVRGPAFRDNRITGEFILRKEDGRWKLYDQEVENVEYLN